MSRPQHGTANSVSLFPFLAVLVCAMGALIFLLLVTTRRIRSEAIARAREATPAEPTTQRSGGTGSGKGTPRTPPETNISPDDAQLRARLSRLIETRRHVQTKLDSRRESLGAGRRRINKSQSALERLKLEAREIQSQAERQQLALAKARRERRRFTEQIATVRQRISEADAKSAAAPTRYALLPYDGRTGTTRRPIFIECSERGIRVLPEDVVLGEEDLIGFNEQYNPLLAGARALTGYWAARKRHSQTEHGEPEPYVLLIVRPSGSIAYYAARKLLQSLARDSGYELVPEDWPLALPEVDPEAKAVLETAIQEVLQQRKSVIDVLTGNPPGNRRGGGSKNTRPRIVQRFAGRSGNGRTRRRADGESPPPASRHGPGETRKKPRFSEKPGFLKTREGNQAAHGGRETSAQADGTAGSSGSGTQRARALPPPEGNRPAASHGGRSRRQSLGSSPSREKSESRRWGLSNRGARIGFERELTIRVEADRLLVGDDHVIPIADGVTTEALIDEVIEAIDAQARAWGPPPESFYWVPAIRFVVSPDGDGHYERLRGPLTRLGLSLRREDH